MKKRYQFDIKRMNADCEANYLRLCRLLPSLPDLAETARERADASSGQFEFEPLQRQLLIELAGREPGRLMIKVQEQCRYTTTLALELVMSNAMDSAEATGKATRDIRNKGGFGNSLSVSLQLRMYHDVRLVEVIAFDGVRAGSARYEYPNITMFQPDEKAQQNHFLAELLSLGLHRGMATEFDEHGDLLEMLNAIREGSSSAVVDCGAYRNNPE